MISESIKTIERLRFEGKAESIAYLAIAYWEFINYIFKHFRDEFPDDEAFNKCRDEMELVFEDPEEKTIDGYLLAIVAALSKIRPDLIERIKQYENL